MASRNVQAIERALSELGLILKEARWKPWGMAMEMQGISGGWFVIAVDPTDDFELGCGDDPEEYEFLGLSTEEVLEDIYRHTYSRSLDFWAHYEHPETGQCFWNDYGFGEHVCVEGAHR